MENNNHNTVMQVQVRKAADDRLAAIRSRDIKAVMAFYDPEVIAFDVVGALQFKGIASVQERLLEWLSSFKQGSFKLDVVDLNIISGEEIAFCHCLNHVQANTLDGNILDMYWRETTCYKRMEGKWLIIHTHSSVPFDVGNGMASLHLQP